MADKIEDTSDKKSQDRIDRLLSSFFTRTIEVKLRKEQSEKLNYTPRSFLSSVISYLHKDLKYENPPHLLKEEQKKDIFETLDDILQADTAQISTIQKHFEAVLPSTATPDELTDIVRDVSFFLGTVAYARPSDSKLSSLITARNIRNSSIGKRSYYQKALYKHITSGGVLTDLPNVSRLFDFLSISSDPFIGLYNSNLYNYGGYNSFSSVLYHIFTLDPKSTDEAQEIMKNIKEVSMARTNALIEYGILSERKVQRESNASKESTHRIFNEERNDELDDLVTSDRIFTLISAAYQKLPHKEISDLTLIQSYVSKYLSVFGYNLASFKNLSDTIKYIIKGTSEHFRNLIEPLLDGFNRFSSSNLSQSDQVYMTHLKKVSDLPIERLLIYKANIKSIRDINKTLFNKQFSLAEKDISASLLDYLSTASSQELANQEEIRRQITETFTRDYAAILLIDSYIGKFSSFSAAGTAEVIRCYKNININKINTTAKESGIREFNRRIQRQFYTASLVNTEKLRQFYESLEIKIDKNQKSHSTRNSSLRSKELYELLNSFHEVLFNHYDKFSADKHIEYLGLINNGFLNDFVNKWLYNKTLLPSSQQALTLFDDILTKFDIIIKTYRNDPAEKRARNCNKWFAHIISQDNLTSLRHFLMADFSHESALASTAESRIKEETNSGKDKINPVADFQEEGEVLSKLAAIYGRSPSLSVALTEPIIDEVIFPTLYTDRLSLPKYVHFFSSHDGNKAVYKLLTFMQASAMRFGYVPSKKDNIANKDNITNTFSDYSNPTYAERLWTILTYNQAMHCVAEQHPNLSSELSETIEKIAVISHAKLAGKKPAYKVLSLLEQSLLLGKDIAVAGEDEKTIASFIDGKLLPVINESNKESLDEMYTLTRRLYEMIDKEFNLKEYETQKQAAETSLIYNQNFSRFAGSYTDQPFFFFDEFQGTARSKVIIKQASAVANDRMAKVKLEHASQIKKIKSLLEAITPARVTVERRLYDGEIDETAYVEMMLEKKMKKGAKIEKDLLQNKQFFNDLFIRRGLSVSGLNN